MRRKKLAYYSLFLVMTFFLYLLSDSQKVCAAVFPLDEETIFCIYYKMSGEYMAYQDIEELCISLGNPLFTAYKPSEMFTKNSLRQIQAQLVDKINALDGASIFKWGFIYHHNPHRATSADKKSPVNYHKMPQATPFIESEISQRGIHIIDQQLQGVIKKLPAKSKTPLQVNIYLKPCTVDYRFEQRNVALETVIFPLRYVVFEPHKVEILSAKPPLKTLLLYEIPRS